MRLLVFSQYYLALDISRLHRHLFYAGQNTRDVVELMPQVIPAGEHLSGLPEWKACMTL